MALDDVHHRDARLGGMPRWLTLNRKLVFFCFQILRCEEGVVRPLRVIMAASSAASIGGGLIGAVLRFRGVLGGVSMAQNRNPLQGAERNSCSAPVVRPKISDRCDGTVASVPVGFLTVRIGGSDAFYRHPCRA